ncbi:putative Ulp1 protease family catalytic domain, GAF-like domain superfamily [Helianthus debilis subsp. tardiflorus]
MDNAELDLLDNYELPQDLELPLLLDYKLTIYHCNHVLQRRDDVLKYEQICSALSDMRLYHPSLLAQLWVPIEFKFGIVLTTCGQPFGLSRNTNKLWSYRVACLDYNSYVDHKTKVCIGPPGRVFRNKSPEWVQDVKKYNDKQYPQLEAAKCSNIRGSFFMPVIKGDQCIGVLEFAMNIQKDDFAYEMGEVCRALEKVGFTSLVKNESINFETLEDYSPKLESGDTPKKRRRNSKSKKITRNYITKPFGLRKADANPKNNFKFEMHEVCSTLEKKGLNSSVQNENINFDTSEDHSLLLESCNMPTKRRKGKSTKIARNHITKLFGLRKEDAIKICRTWSNFTTLAENTFTKAHKEYGIWEWPCTRSGIVKSSAYKALIEHAEAFLTNYGVAQQTKTKHSSFIESDDTSTKMHKGCYGCFRTTMTSAYHPCLQMIDEDDHQLPSPLMEDQDLFTGGFVNMLVSMEQQQTTTNAPIQVSEPVRLPEPVPAPAPKHVPILKPKPKKVRKSKLVPKRVSVPVPKPVLATVPKLEPHIKLITSSDGETWEDPNLNSIKENLRNKTGLIRDIVDKLEKLFKHRTHIRTSSPQGMYPIPVQYLIPYSEFLSLFLRRWLDISVIHSFSMYFFLSPNSRCAFFDPYKITGAKCESAPEDVIKHIKEVYEYHEDKRYFLAPYHDNDHWKLLIFEPTTSSAFIVDSIKKGKSEESYLISELIPSGFEKNFTWTVINCYQQPGSWECGYMLIKHMWEFVETIQHDFINRKWNTQEKTSGEEIEFMVVDLMERWIKEVFGVRT